MVASTPGLCNRRQRTNASTRFRVAGSVRNRRRARHRQPVCRSSPPVSTRARCEQLKFLTGGIPAGVWRQARRRYQCKHALWARRADARRTCRFRRGSFLDRRSRDGLCDTHQEVWIHNKSLGVSTSRRYLDPPSIENFHNLGRTGQSLLPTGLSVRRQQHAARRIHFRRLKLSGSKSSSHSKLLVRIKEQRLRDNSQNLSYQHVFSPNAVAQFSFFHRQGNAKLASNPSSVPVVANQDRNTSELRWAWLQFH